MKKKSQNNKLSKAQIICFILIAIVCIFAIFEAVYVVLFSTDGSIENVTTSVTNNVPVDEKQNLKENFLKIFQNDLTSNVDTVSIEKKDNKYNLIYTAYNKVEKSAGKYDINVQLPHINIDSVEAENINNQINNTFQAKSESILAEDTAATNTVYNIKYKAYLNNDILSLVLECTLKEGNNAQRIIIKTYNYNMKTKEQVKIEELTEIKKLNKNMIESKIKEEIDSQISMEKSLTEAGYEVFNRYPNSDMYKFESLNNFFIDEKDNLYVLFAYGNTNNTSEMDIIIY